MYPAFGGLGPYGTYGNLGLFGALVAYGTERLTDTSPPQSFAEPLTVAEVVSYLRLPSAMAADAAMESELGAMIASARGRAEIAQGRDLVLKQWDRWHDYWPSYRIELRSPVNSVDLIQYRNSDGVYARLTENTDFIVDKSKQPAVVAPPYNLSWPTFNPWPSSALLIRYTSGVASTDSWWAECGPMVKSGMRLLIKSWFNREPADEGKIQSLLSSGYVPRAK